MSGKSAALAAHLHSRGRLVSSEALIDDPEFLKGFGITRVGDVTDLDVIGVPVWFAARPNSRGLSVAQGKGLTVSQAKLSAVMEAIEGAVAEDTRRHVKHFGSFRQMQERNVRLVPLDMLARVDYAAFDPDRERAWVAGFSAKTGSDVFAPYELVGMDFRSDFPWDRLAFRMGSQGLAAGFDLDRAVLHALLELVENDACFAIDTFETRQIGLRPFVPRKGESKPLDDLLARLAEVGLKPRLFDLTGANGVPVVLASLPRTVIASDGPGERIAGGVACRLDRNEAAISALLEAIQSRLTDISGARDDLTARRYDAGKSIVERIGSRAVLSKPTAVDIVDSNPSVPAWRQLGNHLLDTGVGDIYVFPLDSGRPEISVVRVLAAGLAVAGAGMNSFSLGALDAFLCQ